MHVHDDLLIESKVVNLINDFMRDIDAGFNNISDPNELLSIIISDSVQAMNFIVHVEDEFDIEIEDDDISMEFFTDFNVIAGVVRKNLLQSN